MSASTTVAELPSSNPALEKWMPALRGLAVLLVIFVLYRLLRIGIGGIAKADYESFSFLTSSLVRSLSDGRFILLLPAAVAIGWLHRGGTWKEVLGETRFGIVIWATVVILVWSAALYPFNFYYGRAHLLDRLAVVATGALCLRYPAAIPVFTFCVMSSYGQWRFTLGDPEITNRKIVLDLLFTLNAILLLRRWKWLNPNLVVITLVSVNLIHYWIPGLAKFDAGNAAVEWLVEDRPSNMMVAGYFVGWNQLWDEAGMVQLYQWLAPLEFPLKIFVLVVELALLASFLNHRLMVALTLGRVLLHTGIWILSGDTFWNWILLQLAITVAFWRKPKVEGLFGPLPAALSAIFVLWTSHSYQASPLGWMDSRLFERYDLYAITNDNERVQLEPDFFEPYSFIFCQTKFHFLLGEDDKTLTRTYGAIHDPRIAKRMRAAKTVDDVRAIIAEEGTVEVDEKKVRALRRFLKRWFTNHREKSGGLSHFLDWLSPPPHAYAFARRDKEPYDRRDYVKKVEIVYRPIFFDGENVHVLDERVVHSVSVK